VDELEREREVVVPDEGAVEVDEKVGDGRIEREHAPQSMSFASGGALRSSDFLPKRSFERLPE